MPETRTGRHCHYCNADGETTRLTLRDACTACARQIDDQRLYFRIPKLFTFKGLRIQVNGFECSLQSTRLSAAGRTPHARSHGRLGSLKLAAAVWIDQWRVLSAAGWRR